MRASKIRVFLFAFITLALITVSFPQAAFGERAVPGDYDGDGRTNIVVTRSLLGGWYWFIRLATGVELTPVLFGLSNPLFNDTPYSGDWNGNGRFSPGVIRKGYDGFLRWYTMQDNGTAQERLWGLVGDTPLTGYFDTDAATDLAVVRNYSGFLYWFIRMASNQEYHLEQWGLDGDAIFVGDLNGNGRSDLVVAREVLGGITWYVRSLEGAALTPIQWGLAGDQLLYPYDFDGDGVDDLTVVRTVGNFLVAYIRYTGPNGTAKGTKVLNFGLARDIPFIGSFNISNRGEFAVYRTYPGAISHHFINAVGDIQQLALFGLEGDTLILPNGSAGAATGSALSQVCPVIIPVSKGTLWKPASDHSGFPRVGRPAMLFSSGRPTIGCLTAYASNGTPVSSLGVYEFSGRYGARFYSGWGCGDRKYGSEMVQAAIAASGKPEIYVSKGGGTCIGPITATRRTGSL